MSSFFVSPRLRSGVREKRLRLGAKFVSSIIHAFFSRAEFPVYIIESQWSD